MFDEKPAEDEGTSSKKPFDFSAFPENTLFHDRREGKDRRDLEELERLKAAEAKIVAPAPERRAKKERRRRIDPTTFEKQYTDDEMEFMNAMQRFKVQTCKSFPSHGDVLRVAISLGYRKTNECDEFEDETDLELDEFSESTD